MSSRSILKYLIAPILAFPCLSGNASDYQLKSGAVWSMACGGPCSYTVRIGEVAKVQLPNNPFGRDRKIIRVQYYPVESYAAGRELKAVRLKSQPKYWFAFCDYKLLGETIDREGGDIEYQPVYVRGDMRDTAATSMNIWGRWDSICSAF